MPWLLCLKFLISFQDHSFYHMQFHISDFWVTKCCLTISNNASEQKLHIWWNIIGRGVQVRGRGGRGGDAEEVEEGSRWVSVRVGMTWKQESGVLVHICDFDSLHLLALIPRSAGMQDPVLLLKHWSCCWIPSRTSPSSSTFWTCKKILHKQLNN